MTPPREDVITERAPAAPPCFESRKQWVEYLTAADRDSQAHALKSGPLVGRGRGLAFNVHFDFCSDCDAAFRTEMQVAGRCKPYWLKQESHEREAAAAP